MKRIELITQDRLLRKIERRDKRIAGLERKIQQLERALSWRTIDLESLSKNIRDEVTYALTNVRMIPVHSTSKSKIIAEVRDLTNHERI